MIVQKKIQDKVNINIGVSYTKKIGKNKSLSVGFKSVFSNKGKPKHFLTTAFSSKRLGLKLSYKL